MLEAMIDLGRVLLADSDLISEKIKKLDSHTKKSEQRHVIKLDFKISDNTLSFALEEIQPATARKYLLLDREGGPNNPQWYLTFERCENLISQSLPNFLYKLNEGELKNKVQSAVNCFFKDWGEAVDVKYRYVLNIHRFLSHPLPLEEMLEQDKKNPHKDLVGTVAALIRKYCEQLFELKKDQIGLFVICIDGETVAENPLYLTAVTESLNDRLDVSDLSKMTACSCCGSSDGCTSDLKDMAIKYYTTNQCIFASNMNNKNYDKNFILCKECYQRLLAAEKFMTNSLRTKITEFNVFVLPQVVIGEQLSGQKYRSLAESIQPLFDCSQNIKDIETFKDGVSNRLDRINKNSFYFTLNFLFYRQSNQATKIQKLIKDVQPSIFEKIEIAMGHALDSFEEHFSEAAYKFLQHKTDLKLVYFLHPIKLQNGSPSQYQKILATYEQLFYQRKLRKERVFDNIVAVLQIIWWKREGYNVSSFEQVYFEYKVLEAMFYIKFLQEFSCLEGGEVMKLDISTLTLSDEQTKSYIQAMGYNEQQAALFLLGMMIGSIGIAQYNRQKGHQDQSGTYKPVLNKINFNGLDVGRITKLSGDIFKKMEEEKVLKYNESLNGDYSMLFGKNRNQWKLNKNENIFYLLSGYSYQTLKKKKEQEGQPNDSE